MWPSDVSAKGVAPTQGRETNDGTRTAVDTITVNVGALVLTANAGADLAVDAGALVTLNGSGSMSSGNLPLTYMWRQTSGPTVTLSSATAAVPTFSAPSAATASMLDFELTVSDGVQTAVDTTSVMVRALPATPQPTTPEESGCGCSSTRSDEDRASVLGFFAIAGLALTLRKAR